MNVHSFPISRSVPTVTGQTAAAAVWSPRVRGRGGRVAIRLPWVRSISVVPARVTVETRRAA